MILDVQTIPHKQQRYPTCGDYWETETVVHFRVSKLPDEKYEWLILIHEIVEYVLVKWANIPITAIDLFDKEFERSRKPGDLSEPGDDPNAPYFAQHQYATHVEKLCAVIFGVDWTAYEDAILKL